MVPRVDIVTVSMSDNFSDIVNQLKSHPLECPTGKQR